MQQRPDKKQYRERESMGHGGQERIAGDRRRLSDGYLITPQSQDQSSVNRSLLSSIGHFFLGGGLRNQDHALQKLMGDVTLEEFLSDENAWLRTIEISHKLWVKEIPASTIKALILEYDEKKELELKNL